MPSSGSFKCCNLNVETPGGKNIWTMTFIHSDGRHEKLCADPGFFRCDELFRYQELTLYQDDRGHCQLVRANGYLKCLPVNTWAST